jgi:6-phosphogluconolactonase (cycloisomerase 2 family)
VAIAQVDDVIGIVDIGPHGDLTRRADLATGPGLPCHVAMAQDGHLVAAALFNGAALAWFDATRRDSFGAIPVGRAEITPDSTSPDPRRVDRDDAREQSRPHWVKFMNDGCRALVACMGDDTIRIFEWDGLELVAGKTMVAARGSGPRNIAVHCDDPRRLFVTGQLDSTVREYHYDGGRGQLREVRVAPASVWSRHAMPSAIVAVRDYVYQANRTPGSVSVFATSHDSLDLVNEVEVDASPMDLNVSTLDGHSILWVAAGEAGVVSGYDLGGHGRIGHRCMRINLPGAAAVVTTTRRLRGSRTRGGRGISARGSASQSAMPTTRDESACSPSEVAPSGRRSWTPSRRLWLPSSLEEPRRSAMSLELR